jgi:dethiobiotin synthetase
MPGLFITGTDTGVGKTLASGALLLALKRLGIEALGMKPVAAGAGYIDGHWVNEDVELLRRASARLLPKDDVNPYLFRAAIAPHIAAEHQGKRIEIPHLVERFKALEGQTAYVIVEGAGGLMVPLDRQRDMADLARALDLPVLLVVGMRLGCINHALLTAEALNHRGLRLAAWIANRLDAEMPAYEENLAYLRDRLGAPMLAEFPSMPSAQAQLVTDYIPNPRLLELLRVLDAHSGRTGPPRAT